jgi:hypothetical protein
MKRVIAHGCSFTFGHSLADCVDEKDKMLPGAYPSTFAYPNLIANSLNRKCINLSIPGTGNFNILKTILEFSYLPSDIVIVLWTSFCRSSIIQEDNSILSFNPWLLDKDHDKISLESYIKYLLKDSNLRKNKYFDIANKFYEVHPDKHLQYASWMYMDYARLKLQKLGVHQFHACYDEWDLKLSPVGDPRSTPLTFNRLIKDFGEDGSHPGPESHRCWANKILEFIG